MTLIKTRKETFLTNYNDLPTRAKTYIILSCDSFYLATI